MKNYNWNMLNSKLSFQAFWYQMATWISSAWCESFSSPQLGFQRQTCIWVGSLAGFGHLQHISWGLYLAIIHQNNETILLPSMDFWQQWKDEPLGTSLQPNCQYQSLSLLWMVGLDIDCRHKSFMCTNSSLESRSFGQICK